MRLNARSRYEVFMSPMIIVVFEFNNFNPKEAYIHHMVYLNDPSSHDENLTDDQGSI